MKFYNYTVKHFINDLLAIKAVRNARDTAIAEKLTALAAIVNAAPEVSTDRQEVDEFTVFDIIFMCLNTKNVEVVLLSLEVFQKLVLFDHLRKILPILASDDTKDDHRTVSHIFVIKIHHFLQTRGLKDSVHLTVIQVLVSLLNMEIQYIPLSSFLTVFNILIDIYRVSTCLPNLSVIKATFATCLMNTFQDFEQQKNAQSDLTFIDNSLQYSELFDSNPLSSKPPSHRKTESTSSIPSGLKTESTQSTNSQVKSSDRVFDLQNYEDIEENNLKIIFKDYELDWSDNKMMRCFCIYERLCRGAIVSKIDQNITNQQLKMVKFCFRCINTCLKNSGPRFQKCECFKEVTRKYLYLAITQDFISQDEKLFRRSLESFIYIVQIFSASLKVQIQKYFNEVILKSLEQNQRDTFHIGYTFRSLIQFCSNTDLMSRLFINYDCDMVSLNIFERIINIVCTFAKNPAGLSTTDTSLSPNQRRELHSMIRKPCLSLLTNILNFLKTTMDKSNAIPTTQSSEDELESIKEGSTKLIISTVKERKDLMLQGIELFNSNPKDGLNFFITHNFIEDSPESIALFLREEQRLNPVQVGEILGLHGQKYIDIMHKYVELMDVKGIDFLESLRSFLSEFRLPGEAQKIDRLMEKFASHYYESNTENKLFSCPDAAYLFAYSIVMLTTDLHNPQVKRKITREQYVDINRNNDGELNVPEEYILNVYESILKNEITLKSQSLVGKSIIDINENKINDINQIKKMQLMNPSVSDNYDIFEQIEQSDIVRSMFVTIWKQLLVCLGWVLKETENHQLTLECLQGIRLCVKIACAYNLDLIRDSFINSLIPFTLLNTNTRYIHDIQKKNVSVVKTLLLIAKEDGNYLRKSWKDILVCISNMEIFQDLKSLGKSHIKNETFNRDEMYKSISIIKVQPQDIKNRFIQIIDELSSQDLLVLIDQIFINSSNFDPEGLIQFVTSLCQVSRSELFTCKPPRTFTLQKILEVVSYNMSRPRLVSTNMWSILSPFLIEVSSLENENISIFCIDSIRQLTCKVLEQKETRNFHYQSDFFKPFEHMILESKYQNVKEHGLRCIHQMISSYAANIGSGWMTILVILKNVLTETDTRYEELAFESLYIITESNFDSTLEYINQILDLIVIFCKNVEIYDINLRTIKLLFNYYKKLENFNNFKFRNKFVEDFTSDKMYRWNYALKNILYAFVRVIQQGNAPVRTEALVLFFNIFKSIEMELSDEQWQDIFRIFEDIFKFIHDKEFSEEFIKTWLDQMCSSIVAGFIELYTSNYSKLPISVTISLFNYLKTTLNSQFDIFKRNMLFILKFILKNLYNQMDEETWKIIIDIMIYMVTKYTPTDFLEYKSDSTSEPLKRDTNTDQNSQLFDYGSYDKNISFRLSNQVNTDNESYKIIETQFNICKFDIKIMETFNSLIKTENLILENDENIKDINLKSVIFLAPKDGVLNELCDIMREHKNYYMKFNTSNKRMRDLVEFIGKSRPDLKMMWDGKIVPNMGVQETLASLCLVKLIHTICFKTQFLHNNFETFSMDIKCILQRYPDLFLQCVNKDICYSLLEHLLTFLIQTPHNSFGKFVKIIYIHLIPLIKIPANENTPQMITKVFERMGEFIGRIDTC